MLGAPTLATSTLTSGSIALIVAGGWEHASIRGGYSVMILDSNVTGRRRSAVRRFASIALIFVSLSLASPWESGAIRSPTIQQDRPTGCEYNTAVLDSLAQTTKLDELIIVIAHLG